MHRAWRSDELEDHCEGGINDDRDLQHKWLRGRIIVKYSLEHVSLTVFWFDAVVRFHVKTAVANWGVNLKELLEILRKYPHVLIQYSSNCW